MIVSALGDSSSSVLQRVRLTRTEDKIGDLLEDSKAALRECAQRESVRSKAPEKLLCLTKRQTTDRMEIEIDISTHAIILQVGLQADDVTLEADAVIAAEPREDEREEVPIAHWNRV